MGCLPGRGGVWVTARQNDIKTCHAYGFDSHQLCTYFGGAAYLKQHQQTKNNNNTNKTKNNNTNKTKNNNNTTTNKRTKDQKKSKTLLYYRPAWAYCKKG